jgi:tRNA(Arg) A34 adenosine deaminase TadA
VTLKQSEFDNDIMLLALKEAKIAGTQGEVPVGCVIVNRANKEVIAQSHNMMQQGKNANFHAEILAINAACQKLDNKNLLNCDIYVTLEPCTMCASAISNARLGRLYYGAPDKKQGSVENGVKFFTSNSCLHRPEIYPGIESTQSEEIIKNFFGQLRKNKLY